MNKQRVLSALLALSMIIGCMGGGAPSALAASAFESRTQELALNGAHDSITKIEVTSTAPGAVDITFHWAAKGAKQAIFAGVWGAGAEDYGTYSTSLTNALTTSTGEKSNNVYYAQQAFQIDSINSPVTGTQTGTETINVSGMYVGLDDNLMTDTDGYNVYIGYFGDTNYDPDRDGAYGGSTSSINYAMFTFDTEGNLMIPNSMSSEITTAFGTDVDYTGTASNLAATVTVTNSGTLALSNVNAALAGSDFEILATGDIQGSNNASLAVSATGTVNVKLKDTVLAAGTYTDILTITGDSASGSADDTETTIELSATIGKAAIDVSSATITGITAAKGYNGLKTGATLSDTNATIAGVNSETLTLSLEDITTVDYKDDANVSTDHTYDIPVEKLAIADKSTAKADNYELTSGKTASFSNGVITKKDITIAPTTSTFNIIKDEATDLSTKAGWTVSGLENNETLALDTDFALSYVISDAKGTGMTAPAAGNHEVTATSEGSDDVTVAVTPSLESTTKAGNYNLTSVAQDLTVTVISGNPPTITWPAVVENNSGTLKVEATYGGSNFSIAPTAITGGSVDTAAAGDGYESSVPDVATVDAAGDVTIRKAGTTTLTIHTKGTGNVAGVPYIDTDFTIALTVNPYDLKTVIDGLSVEKEYDGNQTIAVNQLVGSVVTKAGGTYYLTGVNNEKLVLTAVAGTYDTDGAVGDSKSVTLSGLTLSDNVAVKAANYEYDGHAFATATDNTDVTPTLTGAKITTKALTLVPTPGTKSAVTGWNKTYDNKITAPALGGDADLSGDYMTGKIGSDVVNVTISAGTVGAFADANVANVKVVTVPAAGLKLTGAAAGNYSIVFANVEVTANIAQATPSLELGNLAQTVGSITAVTLTPNPASNDFAGVVEYEIPTAAPVTAASCDCGATDKLAHTVDCAAVTAVCVGTDECASGHSDSNADCPQTPGVTACDCDAGSGVLVATKHETTCRYGGDSGDPTMHCNCNILTGSMLNSASDHAGACAAIGSTGSEWKKFGDAPADATLGLTVGAYLNSLPAGATVSVRGTSTNSTNLAAVSSPVVGTLNINAAPVYSGGGGVSSYTVTYNVGEHGKLAEGAKKTESVNYKKSPSKVPEVVANEGYKFLGWSLDGKTVVDPTAEIITKSITFTALYEAAAKELAFEKEFTAAYMVGMEEGGEKVFKPEAPMTRGEVAVMLARTLTSKMEEGKNYAADKFPDLKGDEWYAQSVGFLAELGVMKGLEDGTCGAEKYITRAEFVALVMRIDGIVTGENKFPDVSADNWAAEPIIAAAAKGYVSGNEMGNFMPGENITRAAVVKIMNGVLGWSWNAEGEMIFTDVTEGHWAYNDIIKASTGK